MEKEGGSRVQRREGGCRVERREAEGWSGGRKQCGKEKEQAGKEGAG